MSNLSPTQRATFEAARRALDAYIPTIADKPAKVNDSLHILRAWKPGLHNAGEVTQHDGIPYKCIQNHDSTANPGWTPPTVPALFMQYHGTSPETARHYLQPQGAHDAYQSGEYAIEGSIYRCKADGTVWPPSIAPTSWEVVA